MIVPVTTTYAPECDFEKLRKSDVNGMVNAVFEYMIKCGTPYDPDTINHFDYGPSLEPYRESLTLFITSWHNLAFAFDDGASDDINGAPDRKLGWAKVWALRAFFKPV